MSGEHFATIADFSIIASCLLGVYFGACKTFIDPLIMLLGILLVLTSSKFLDNTKMMIFNY